jgi:peroxiredoxin
MRSWRYAMVVNDMVVEKMFIENDGWAVDLSPVDPFEVSDAATVLAYLNGK